MSFSKLSSMQLYACEPYLIDVEVDISTGLNAFSIVGLADKAIEEAKDRISAAIKNSDFISPKSKNQKVVISLAPAEQKKEGSNFDLAMALAYLVASDDIVFDPKGKLFLGELSLDGSLRSISGALPLVIASQKLGFKEVYIPYANRDGVSMIDGILIYAVKSLREIISHINTKSNAKDKNGNEVLKESIKPLIRQDWTEHTQREVDADLKDIKGQEGAKRCLLIAAAGGHHVMMYGPPGTGKTMLAKAFSSLLPPLCFEEMLQVTTIHASSKKQVGIVRYPPFRAPHHSATYVSLIGGGTFPKPGEVTLAHKGVLFMDEFPEFDARTIDSLRQPIEDKNVTITRSKRVSTFPSDFILLASMNPCPCGYKGSITKECICSSGAIQNYQRKISGPIVDRIDMWVEVSEVDYKKLTDNNIGMTSEDVRKQIEKVREIQKMRYTSTSIHLNSQVQAKDMNIFCTLSTKTRELLDISAKALHLSARSYHKVIKLARTIADVEGRKEIEDVHILEALQYRPRL